MKTKNRKRITENRQQKTKNKKHVIKRITAMDHQRIQTKTTNTTTTIINM